MVPGRGLMGWAGRGRERTERRVPVVAEAPDDGVVEITAAAVRRVQSRHVRIVRSPLGVADIEDVAGIPVTTAVRAAFDIARRHQLAEAVVVIDAMLARRLIWLSDLVSYVASHQRWPGDAQAAQVIGLVEPRSESPMETRLRLVIVNGGLPRPVAQYEVRDASGTFIGRVDLAYPEWKVAIEYDGDHHRDRATFRDDIRRANALRVAGWTVLRFTASDVWRRPDQVVADIRAVIPA